jgi:hypothetical protein
MKAGDVGPACAGWSVATTAATVAIRRSLRIVQDSTYDDRVLPPPGRSLAVTVA